jgi:hypothetical protein
MERRFPATGNRSSSPSVSCCQHGHARALPRLCAARRRVRLPVRSFGRLPTSKAVHLRELGHGFNSRVGAFGRTIRHGSAIGV